MTDCVGRVLIVAGSDSGGGAGIQADLKAVTALGGYGMTAITALTAQNTRGVFGVHETPLDFVAQQMELVLDDIGADAVKTGMLHAAPVIETVARVLQAKAPGVPLVVDPVMVAKGGHRLLEDEALTTLRRVMPPLATVLTPNRPEAEALTGFPIGDDASAREAGAALLALGPAAVLLKGGHAAGDEVVDILFEPSGETRWTSPRIDTPHTHGTGCTLASAIATGLAQGLSIKDAVARARAYVIKAIETAPGFGHGHGPLNHGHTVRPFPS